MSLAYFFLFSLLETAQPQLVLLAKHKDVVLPRAAKDWDFIGMFELKDAEGKPVPFRLYAFDSDSKSVKPLIIDNFELPPPRFYPNSFALYAVFREESGKWVDEELHSGTRRHFSKVRSVGPQQIELEMHPYFPIRFDPARSDQEWARLREIHRPFVLRIVMARGGPVLK